MADLCKKFLTHVTFSPETVLLLLKIADLLADQSHFSFRVDDCYIRVYCKDAHEAWSAVASLVKRP